jgi:tRNA A37 methylthiotransferase MiaB
LFKKTKISHRRSEEKKPRDSKIIVSGCLPNINPDSVNKISDDFIFVSTRDIHQIDKIINPRVKLNDIKQPDSVSEGNHITKYLIARSYCRKNRIYRTLFWKYFMKQNFINFYYYTIKFSQQIQSILFPNKYTAIEPYYNLSIARGCKSNCTFCATKIAIGGVKSIPEDELIDEFKTALDKGYKTIQLISEDTGCYGIDIKSNLTSLLRKLFEIKGDYKLVIIDFHPRWMISLHKDLVPLLVKNQHKVKDLFIPLQSGSDNVLVMMQRNA